MKRFLLFGRKAISNPDNVLRSRNITLPTKAHIVKAMVFPVAMYRCGSWAIKKSAQAQGRGKRQEGDKETGVKTSSHFF